MNVKERIEAFNEENRPFYIVDHDDGKFSLCLPLGSISGEYEDFGQKAFDAYALEFGEPPVDSRGFQTHGNGYEWEAAFCQAFEGDPNLRRFAFDCESSGFFMDCDDLSLLEEYGSKFREICMDTERFTPIVSQGIKRMDQWLAEQEKLANTVRGALLENPSSTFDIMTPDGNIRITPQDTKQLLDGNMQFVHIGGAQYCAFELLDQEIVQKQTDLFDEDLIRMKTQEPEQELGFKMTM